MKKNKIQLTPEERTTLEKFSTTGVRSVRLARRAKIILALDAADGRKACKQEEIAQYLDVSRQTINNVRQDFLEAENVAVFLQRKKRATPPVEPKVTGELEARIIALACSKAPPGYAKWTLRLLANKCVELQYADSLSHTTVSRLLKKRNFNLT
jgi:transposase